MVVTGILLGLPPSIMMALLPRAVPAEHLATALGVFYALFYLGMAVSQTLAGLPARSHRRPRDALTVRGGADGLHRARRRALLAHRGAARAERVARCRLAAMREPGDILLVACYELGHQPLAVAWPAAFLERAGYRPALMDVSVEPLDAQKLARARVIAISVPMHTALRLGARGRRARPRGEPGRAPLLLRPLRHAQRRLPLRPRRRQRDRRRGGDAAARAGGRARARRRGPAARGGAPGPARGAASEAPRLPGAEPRGPALDQEATRTSSATAAWTWWPTRSRAAGACTAAGTARSRRCTAGASSRCRARSCWPTSASRSRRAPATSPSAIRTSSTGPRTRSRWRARCTPSGPTSPSTSPRRSSTCCATARTCPRWPRPAASSSSPPRSR